MSENDDSGFDLTRRKVLGGLAGVGVASAAAGAGTMALFSDTESSTDNQIQAGTLDLAVDYETGVSGASGDTTGSGEINGSPASGQYQISNAKPGDSGYLRFSPKVVGSVDGWVFVGSSGVTESENGQNEAEAADDATTGSSKGDLAEAIQVTVTYVSPDGSTERELKNPSNYTLADLSTDLESGFLLDGEMGTSGRQAYPSSGDADTQNGPQVRIDWEIPSDVGNEIQSDSVNFDIKFAGIQAPNNPDPDNPFVDIPVGSSGYDYSSLDAALSAAGSDDVVGLASETFTLSSSSSTTSLSGAHLAPIDPTAGKPTVEIDGPQFKLGSGATVTGLGITLLSGGKVYAGSGDGLRFTDNVVSISSSSNYGLRIEGVGDDEAVVARNTFDQTTASSGTPQGVLISDVEGIIVRNNTFQGDATTGQAVLVTNGGSGSPNANDVHILDNDVTNAWANGVMLYEDTGNIWDVQITGNSITGTSDTGIVAADTGTDGFEDLNGENTESAQETALANDNSANSVDVVLNV